MAQKRASSKGLASAKAEWADFDDIFSGSQNSELFTITTNGSNPEHAKSSPNLQIPKSDSIESPGLTRADSDLSTKDEKKKMEKKKCAVKGCKNKRFRRRYCALHLNSEFDKEKDQDTKTPVKNFDDWSVTKSVQSGAYFRKNVITWRFVYKGEKHTVMLKHSPVGGKKVIFIDGTRKISEKTPGGSKHPLNIGNTDATKVPCAVVISSGIAGLEYDLEIKGGKFADAQHIWMNSLDI